MSATPRTDAAWTASFDTPQFIGSAHTARVMRDECAKIEAELVLLKSDYALVWKNYNHVGKWYDESVQESSRLRAEVNRLTAERNRLRDVKWEGIHALEQRAEKAEAKVAALVATKDKACAAATENKAEADQLRAEVARLTHERDQWEAMARTA